MDEVEHLGLARGSVSFKGVDVRHNSSSSAASPYNFLAANTSFNASSQFSKSTAGSFGPASDIRNPMTASAAAERSRNSGASGWLRGSELEMRSTKGGVYLLFLFISMVLASSSASLFFFF